MTLDPYTRFHAALAVACAIRQSTSGQDLASSYVAQQAIRQVDDLATMCFGDCSSTTPASNAQTSLDQHPDESSGSTTIIGS